MTGEPNSPAQSSPRPNRAAFPLLAAAGLACVGLLGVITPSLVADGPGSEPVWLWLLRAAFLGAAVALGWLRRRRAIQRWSKRLLALTLALSFSLAAWEAVFWALLPGLPLNQQPFLDSPTSLASQSSKGARWPRDYVALCGDSYAQGMGDWLLGCDHGANASYYSGHVLHEALGRDVVTFGHSGSGALEGLVLRPLSWLEVLKRRHGLEPPRLWVVYFYEGNDLSDNVRDLQRLSLYDPRAGQPPRVPFARLESELPQLLRKEIARLDGQGHLPGLRFLRNKIGRVVDRGLLSEVQGIPLTPLEVATGFNRASLLSGEQELPSGLQGPGLFLTPEETEASLRVFEVCLRSLAAAAGGPSSVTLIYLPSPLSCYRLVSPVRAEALWDRPGETSPEAVRARSDALAARVRACCEAQGVDFEDLRPGFREAARSQILHGPHDWQHLNERGQRLLGSLVAGAIREKLP